MHLKTWFIFASSSAAFGRIVLPPFRRFPFASPFGVPGDFPLNLFSCRGGGRMIPFLQRS